MSFNLMPIVMMSIAARWESVYLLEEDQGNEWQLGSWDHSVVLSGWTSSGNRYRVMFLKGEH